MADISPLLHARVHDAEAFEEFANALADLAPRIERDIARLKRSPGDGTTVADLFRALHTIKGDAAICRVELAVAVAHPMETLLARLRAGELPFSDLLAEVFLLGLDRLELATEALGAGRPLLNLRLPELVAGLEDLAAAGPEQVNGLAVRLVETVTGFRPALADAVLRTGTVATSGRRAHGEDLGFFRDLAHQLEARSPLYRGRSGRLLRLALDTNSAAGRPVDPVQLEAAVLMHDVGMMFLPESVWLKVGNLSDEDRRALRRHPTLGAGLLARMEGWQEAAVMVAQHHERPDGSGYPAGLRQGAIVPGAHILAIVDAFEAVTLKHSHRGQNRSLLRAVAEINACDEQFAPEWIGRFNGVIRGLVKSSATP